MSRAVRLGLALMLSGCATTLAASLSPSIATDRSIGGEGRAKFVAATGSDKAWILAGIGAGGGAIGARGYGEVSAIVGGRLSRGSISGASTLFYQPRFFFTGARGVAHGGGGDVEILFHLARTGGEDGSLMIGPRFAAEAMAESTGVVGLFQLGLSVWWVTFNTTARACCH